MALLKAGGYGHRIQYLGADFYRLTWIYDVKHGRIRFPRVMTRDTDLAGALRFAKKWDVRMPTEEPDAPQA